MPCGVGALLRFLSNGQRVEDAVAGLGVHLGVKVVVPGLGVDPAAQLGLASLPFELAETAVSEVVRRSQQRRSLPIREVDADQQLAKRGAWLGFDGLGAPHELSQHHEVREEDAADRDENRVAAGHLVEDFKRERALAGDALENPR